MTPQEARFLFLPNYIEAMSSRASWRATLLPLVFLSVFSGAASRSKINHACYYEWPLGSPGLSEDIPLGGNTEERNHPFVPHKAQ